MEKPNVSDHQNNAEAKKQAALAAHLAELLREYGDDVFEKALMDALEETGTIKRQSHGRTNHGRQGTHEATLAGQGERMR